MVDLLVVLAVVEPDEDHVLGQIDVRRPERVIATEFRRAPRADRGEEAPVELTGERQDFRWIFHRDAVRHERGRRALHHDVGEVERDVGEFRMPTDVRAVVRFLAERSGAEILRGEVGVDEARLVGVLIVRRDLLEVAVEEPHVDFLDRLGRSADAEALPVRRRHRCVGELIGALEKRRRIAARQAEEVLGRDSVGHLQRRILRLEAHQLAGQIEAREPLMDLAVIVSAAGRVTAEGRAGRRVTRVRDLQDGVRRRADREARARTEARLNLTAQTR